MPTRWPRGVRAGWRKLRRRSARLNSSQSSVTGPAAPSGAVAALELLAAAAPAGVVPADVLVLVDGRRLRKRAAVARRRSRERGCRTAGGGDDVGPRGGLVLVGERALRC